MLDHLDPGETQEWIDELDSVLAFEGAERAFHLLDEVVAEARHRDECRRRRRRHRDDHPPPPDAVETVGMSAEALDGTITDLYVPGRKQ